MPLQGFADQFAGCVADAAGGDLDCAPGDLAAGLLLRSVTLQHRAPEGGIGEEVVELAADQRLDGEVAIACPQGRLQPLQQRPQATAHQRDGAIGTGDHQHRRRGFDRRRQGLMRTHRLEASEGTRDLAELVAAVDMRDGGVVVARLEAPDSGHETAHRPVDRTQDQHAE